MKYLYPYECEREKLSSPGELQSAIDGNRREGRRSGSSFNHHHNLPGAGHHHQLSFGQLSPSLLIAQAAQQQQQQAATPTGRHLMGGTVTPNGNQLLAGKMVVFEGLTDTIHSKLQRYLYMIFAKVPPINWRMFRNIFRRCFDFSRIKIITVDFLDEDGLMAATMTPQQAFVAAYREQALALEAAQRHFELSQR